MRTLILIAAALLMTASAADAKCKRAPNSPICEKGADPRDCEELCITTSDTGKEQYSDDRKRQRQMRERQHEFFQQRRAAAEAQQRQFARERVVQHYQQRAEQYRTQKRIDYINRYRDMRDMRYSNW